MATNTERINTISSELDRLGARFEERTDRLYEADREQKADIKTMEKSVEGLLQRNASLEQRCAALEKQSDRGWQLWLAALGFGFGLISLLVTTALQLKK